LAEADRKKTAAVKEEWKSQEERQEACAKSLKDALSVAKSDAERKEAIDLYGSMPVRNRISFNPPPCSPAERRTARLLFEEACKDGEIGLRGTAALVTWAKMRRINEDEIHAEFTADYRLAPVLPEDYFKK